MKRLVIGMTAHVDAGKTTLSEALLYCSGALRKLGRVDAGNAFLDTHAIERSRGITVFAKQAVLQLDGQCFTLLDTPGHIDFSAETERALRVLDYAILVISGTEGVQSHTETLWAMLRRYRIPVLLFVNKMDSSAYDPETLLGALQAKLSRNLVPFDMAHKTHAFYEQLAMCSEPLMERFLADGSIPDAEIAAAIAAGTVFPCCFGSALKLTGMDNLLQLLSTYTIQPAYPEAFSALVYKITTENGIRLTHMKLTGGTLPVRTLLQCGKGDAAAEEKVSQIRIYSGAKYQAVEEASAGTLCAVAGLTQSFAGEGLGTARDTTPPLLRPVLSYRVLLPAQTDAHTVLSQLRLLEEEEPQLHVLWQEQLQEIHVQLMGEIQLEILKSLLAERFGTIVSFDAGSIAYKETIAAPVEGVGHYEPLRHYAEVHLLLEPGQPGSGLVFATDCSEDQLSRNWQRLVLTHLADKTHLGVLTGSPITDLKITLIAGRAHLKHTEGGDFRQATYRAVRMGLQAADSVLLEPYYNFRLEVPASCVGRALHDLQRMEATFSTPVTTDDTAVITGTAPVATLRSYHTELAGFTKGTGRLTCTLHPDGYLPCHNPEAVIAEIGYESEADLANPADSVFCTHGAGYVVPWYEVTKKMHLPARRTADSAEATEPAPVRQAASRACSRLAEDKELMAIFERTYGKINREPRSAMHRAPDPPTTPVPVSPATIGDRYLLVDGYNIIFAWDELKALAKDNLDLARETLIQMLCNYQGFRQCNVILVFDAYKLHGNPREIERHRNITVVYTKEAETADMYIEKVTHKLGKDNQVRVATSDRLEQIIILGNHAYRISAEEFHRELKATEQEIRGFLKE